MEIKDQGNQVYSISEGNLEYMYSCNNFLADMPRFICTKISGFEIHMYLDVNAGLTSAYTHSLFKNGKLAGLMLCTNPPKNKRALKNKVLEVLGIINEAIAKAHEFGYIDVEFEEPTEAVLEKFAKAIVKHYRDNHV